MTAYRDDIPVRRSIESMTWAPPKGAVGRCLR
jgi:hypothetical protein